MHLGMRISWERFWRRLCSTRESWVVAEHSWRNVKASRRLPIEVAVISSSARRVENHFRSPQNAGADAHQAHAAAGAQFLEHGQFMAEVVEVNRHGSDAVFLG